LDDATGERLGRELRTLRGLNSWLHNPVACAAQPGSDLSIDESRLPDIWTTTVVHRSLKHVVECLSVAGALVPGEEWMHAPFVLLRGAYESAALAVWLLEPDSVDARLNRLIAQHEDSWKYSAKAYSGTTLDDGGLHDTRRKSVTRMIEDAGVDPSECRFPGFERLIESADDFPGDGKSLLTAWRVCSGVSHAKTWALNAVSIEVDRISEFEHGHISARVANPGLAVTLLAAGRRTVERARALCAVRTSARPHSIRVEMTTPNGG
jgi:hypothetical protein